MLTLNCVYHNLLFTIGCKPSQTELNKTRNISAHPRRELISGTEDFWVQKMQALRTSSLLLSAQISSGCLRSWEVERWPGPAPGLDGASLGDLAESLSPEIANQRWRRVNWPAGAQTVGAMPEAGNRMLSLVWLRLVPMETVESAQCFLG